MATPPFFDFAGLQNKKSRCAERTRNRPRVRPSRAVSEKARRPTPKECGGLRGSRSAEAHEPSFDFRGVTFSSSASVIALLVCQNHLRPPSLQSHDDSLHIFQILSRRDRVPFDVIFFLRS